MPPNKIKPTILMILDGFGHGQKYRGNAVDAAHTTNLDQLNQQYPHTLLKASGQAVGVPKGVMGASEPGHVTIGAGRTIWQPFEEINVSIKDKSFFAKKPLIKACQHVLKRKSALHLIGLLSDGGIHSHQNHLYALLKLAQQQKVSEVYIHVLTDGRDVPERSIKTFLEDLKKQINKIKLGQIASIIGRFYAMDRDTNWDRTQKAYDLLVSEEGTECAKFETEIAKYYQQAKKEEATDYYLPPLKSKTDFKAITPDDAVIFFNFRSDRARQLTSAFVDQDFDKFPAPVKPFFVCMGPYSHSASVVFPPPKIKNNLGEFLSNQGLKQLRIAETEKYAHVTFFFNSQVEEPYPGEDRILVQSPKVASYAEKPEMSAYEVTKKVLAEIKKKKYDFILINYANPDLVGHSGDFEAVVKACETVDDCAGQVCQAAQKAGYDLIITADHGNAEEMLYYGTDVVCPAHTTNPVNCILVSEDLKNKKLKKDQGLANLAPTILDIMGIKKPEEMTGESLID